jgi:hypothetical protein
MKRLNVSYYEEHINSSLRWQNYKIKKKHEKYLCENIYLNKSDVEVFIKKKKWIVTIFKIFNTQIFIYLD